MRILVLGKYYPPYYGGIETLTRSLCEGFARLGGEVTCVVANDQPRTVIESIQGVRVERCARFGSALSVPACPRYLTAARRPVDILHLHFPNPLADLAMWFGRRTTPLVVTYHSDIVRQKAAMRLYAPLMHWLLRRAQRITVATPPQLSFSDPLVPHRDRCEIIPFGLDLTRFDQPGKSVPAVEEARAAARGRTILLNIGRLVGYKGQRYLIEALRFTDSVAWLVGTGPLRGELERVARVAKVTDRIRFWGDVEDTVLPALLHACDIFVLSSITPNEAFGLVQVEAMACGKPVISCQISSGVPFVNQDNVTGIIVPPSDANALAQAIHQITSDAALARRLGEGGRRRAHTEFSLDGMVGRYWKLFERLTGGRGER